MCGLGVVKPAFRSGAQAEQGSGTAGVAAWLLGYSKPQGALKPLLACRQVLRSYSW